jgi:5-oxoprolinase (ATP-hydrolysing)
VYWSKALSSFWDYTQTIVVSPEAKATIVERHILLDLEKKASATVNETAVDRAVDPVKLTIMAHRFMSITEKMGHVLQKASVSVNIKERLNL